MFNILHCSFDHLSDLTLVTEAILWKCTQKRVWIIDILHLFILISKLRWLRSWKMCLIWYEQWIHSCLRGERVRPCLPLHIHTFYLWGSFHKASHFYLHLSSASWQQASLHWIPTLFQTYTTWLNIQHNCFTYSCGQTY